MKNLILVIPCLVFFSATMLFADTADKLHKTSTKTMNSQQVHTLQGNGLDEDTVDLFTSAVASLYESSSILTRRLSRIENRMKLLQAENRYLREELSKRQKKESIQKNIQRFSKMASPLDKEVEEANSILEQFVHSLSRLAL